MNRALILAEIQGSAWAIMPERLNTIVAIATEGRVNVDGFPKTGPGGYEGAEALADRDGVSDKSGKITYYNVKAPDKSTQKVAMLDWAGPSFRRANLMTEHSGATHLGTQVKQLNALLLDKTVASIVIDYDSPGGEVNGTSEMANLIYRARSVKPIVGFASNMAASAAYWIASASTELYLDPTAAVGSIGVVKTSSKSGEEDVLEIVSSQSPNKRPNLETKEGRAVTQEYVDSVASVFVNEVAAYRGVTPEKVLSDFGQGSVLVGESAVKAGMANGTATFNDVLNRAAVLAIDFKKSKPTLSAGRSNVSASNQSNKMDNQEMDGELAIAALQKQVDDLVALNATYAAQANENARIAAQVQAAMKESRVAARDKEAKELVSKAVAEGVINASSEELVRNIVVAAGEMDEIFASSGKEQITVAVEGVSCVGVSQMILAVLDAKSSARATSETPANFSGIFAGEKGKDTDFDIDAAIAQANAERGHKA